MISTLWPALVLATGGLFSIGSIIAVILFLSSAQGLRKAAAYYFGYTGVYFLIGLGILALGNRVVAGSDEPEQSSPFWAIVMVALGFLLLTFAVRQWRAPSNKPPPMKRMLDRLSSMNPLKAFLFGALIPFINFKNLPIFLAAVSMIMAGNLSLYQELASVVAVTVTFNAGIATPIVLYLAFGSRASAWLVSFRHGLEQHNRALSITIMLIFGTVFILRGVFQLL